MAGGYGAIPGRDCPPSGEGGVHQPLPRRRGPHGAVFSPGWLGRAGLARSDRWPRRCRLWRRLSSGLRLVGTGDRQTPGRRDPWPRLPYSLDDRPLPPAGPMSRAAGRVPRTSPEATRRGSVGRAFPEGMASRRHAERRPGWGSGLDTCPELPTAGDESGRGISLPSPGAWRRTEGDVSLKSAAGRDMRKNGRLRVDRPTSCGGRPSF